MTSPWRRPLTTFPRKAKGLPARRTISLRLVKNGPRRICGLDETRRRAWFKGRSHDCGGEFSTCREFYGKLKTCRHNLRYLKMAVLNQALLIGDCRRRTIPLLLFLHDGFQGLNSQ